MYLTNQARENEYLQLANYGDRTDQNLIKYQQQFDQIVNKWGSTTHIK